MKYPNIKRRFIVAFGILILLTCLFVILVIENFKSINRINNQLIEHPYTVSNSIRDINRFIYDINLSIRAIVLDEKVEQIDSLAKVIHRYDEQALNKFDIIKERYLGKKEDVEFALHAYSDWKAIRDKIIELSAKGDFEQANKMRTSLGIARVNIFNAKTQTITDFADNKSKQFNLESMHRLENARKNFTILVFAFILVSMVTSYWLFRSISLPIKKIINQIKTISKDYFKRDILSSEKNIVDILDLAVNDLEETSKKLAKEVEEGETLRKELQSYMDNLEELVKERSSNLADAKQLLEKAIDNAPVGMAMITPENNYISINQAFCDMMGFTSDELLNKSFLDITHESDKDKELIIKKELLTGKILKASYEKRYVRKDGQIIHAHITSSLVRNDKGEPIYFFKQALDITNRKKAEAELQEHKENLEQMVKERTLELETKNTELVSKNKELERYNEIFVGREFRIKKLKEEIKELKKSKKPSP